MDMAEIANLGIANPYKKQYGNYIGGQWVPPVDGQYFENSSPINGQVFTSCRVPTTRNVNAALDAAHKAKAAWGKTSTTDRANILLKIADRMEANLLTIAVAETIDNGKPLRETMAADIPLAIDHFRYFAGAVRAQEGGISEIDHDTMAYHFHEPLGVVGQIIPWNFPILMAVWKLAPALAAGNCVVLKPAEQTPASILVLLEMIGDLLPPGVVNVVNGFGLEAGKPLASSNRIAKIAFTGETTTAGSSCSTPARTSFRSRWSWAARAPTSSSRTCWPPTRLLRQGAGRLRHVRAEPGRGLHLPQPRADPGIDLRPLHGTRPEARGRHHAGPSARQGHHDRRAGLAGAAGEESSRTWTWARRKAPNA